MSAKNKRGLGRGIEALFEDSGEQSATKNKINNIFDTLPIDQIKPNALQPRKTFDKELLNQLAASIKDKGVLQPIVVREAKGDKRSWQIIAGERFQYDDVKLLHLLECLDQIFKWMGSSKYFL